MKRSTIVIVAAALLISASMGTRQTFGLVGKGLVTAPIPLDLLERHQIGLGDRRGDAVEIDAAIAPAAELDIVCDEQHALAPATPL